MTTLTYVYTNLSALKYLAKKNQMIYDLLAMQLYDIFCCYCRIYNGNKCWQLLLLL